MNKICIIISVLMIVLGAASCSQTDVIPGMMDDFYDSDAILTAKIMDISDAAILLANMADDAGPADIYRLNADNIGFIIDDDGQKLDKSALETGMLVDIAFDDIVQDSFPMGLGSIKGICIKSRGDDIAGLYRRVIDDLYAVDPGLNDGISILAFDLTKLSNMTEAEKTALIYLVGNAYGMQAIAGTYDELCEQGYIDKDKLYFEKGLLFSIEDNAISGDSFTFDAQKWRSGLGAYFFHRCTARKTKDGWDYTIGAEMIS
jgi:hypothetical protein